MKPALREMIAVRRHVWHNHCLHYSDDFCRTMEMNQTPATLLDRLRGRGRPEDWARLLGLYTPLLVLMARRLAVPEQDIPDLVQDVFAILAEKLPSFAYDPSRRFRGWLWTVTKNRWLTQRRQYVILLAGGEIAEGVTPDDNPIEEDEFRQHVVRHATGLIRAEFPEKIWQAFWKSVIDDRPAKDVAAELGMTSGAVWTAKSRVLKRLREEFGGLLD